MSTVRWSPTVYSDVLELASRAGPQTATRYAYVVEEDAHYAWYLGSSLTADQINIITPMGGGIGQWIRIRSVSRGADLTDADATITISEGRWRVLPLATLTAARVLTIGDDYASEGDQMTITRLDMEAFTYQVDNGGGGGGTLVTFGAGARAFLDVEFDGTDWIVKQSGEML
ncbi:MAG: hypothetical protein KKC50_08375 [Candidatus Omnitrophica bacterium]|nr:hypothetical protein [Candidatus Omnitrophota bacterium]MBU1008446.1 hypothetical protein [Candidatus Dependentiae bacterium]